MTFINTELDITGLPRAEELELRPLDPAYLKLLRWEWRISTLILSGAAGALILLTPSLRPFPNWLMVAAGVTVFNALYYIFQERGFPFKAYAIREHDVVYQKGWLIRSTRICPFNRIQNCSLQSGPMERKAGLASITLYTAGTSGGDLHIPGLLKEEAENLRQFILSRIHAEQQAN